MALTRLDRQLWEILVPCVRNDGRPVTTKHHKEWDRKVRKISAGLTVLSPAKGQWVDDHGSLYEERVIPVRIACHEAQIEQIVSITIQHYEQEAVMVYLVSSDCRVYQREKKLDSLRGQE